MSIESSWEAFSGSFAEGHEVVRTIEVVAKTGGRTFRVEIVRAMHRPEKPFEAWYSERKRDGRGVSWETYDFGWVRADDADDALHQALGWIALRLSEAV